MWIFSTVGFFSAVAHREKPDTIIIRARVKKDLIDLKIEYMPELGTITYSHKADYPYRAEISKRHFALGVGMMAMDIDYDNFKSEVSIEQGSDRSMLYGKVWGTLLALEEDKSRPGKYHPGSYRRSDHPRPTVKHVGKGQHSFPFARPLTDSDSSLPRTSTRVDWSEGAIGGAPVPRPRPKPGE